MSRLIDHASCTFPVFMSRVMFFLQSGTLFVFLAVLCSATPTSAGPAIDSGLIEKLRLESTTIRGDKLQVNLLLRAVGRKAGVNVLVDDTIDDTITLDLENVNLYDLFRLILETRELRFYESNQALIVKKAADFKKDQLDVIVARLCPQYRPAADHADELAVLISEEGSLTVSSDGNCLVVRDHEDIVTEVADLLDELDRPIPQVHIKARIVTIDKSVARELGVKWGYTDLENLPQDSLTAVTDLSVIDPTTNIVFGFIRDTFTLDLELSALQERNQLEILSEPRVVVLDGQEAEIKQGKEVPYESGSFENRNTSFREAVLGLTVTPKIMQNNFIRLDVQITNDSVDENSTEDGQPLLNRQEIKTNLFLENGITVVIGGILSKGTDETRGEVPWLGELPLIGGLFRNTDQLDRTYELMVFLTPTILQGSTGHYVSKKSLDPLQDLGNKSGKNNGFASRPTEKGNRASGVRLLPPPLKLEDN